MTNPPVTPATSSRMQKRKKGWRKFTPEQIIAALDQSQGMIQVAARALGCSAETIQVYRHEYPEIAEFLEFKRGELIDLGEIALRKAVGEGQPWAVCFLLKTLGKERGYIERAELTGKDGGVLQAPQTVIEIRWLDNTSDNSGHELLE
jgi:hypothetical protein